MRVKRPLIQEKKKKKIDRPNFVKAVKEKKEFYVYPKDIEMFM